MHSISLLPPTESQNLLTTLKTRFDKNKSRHPNIDWSKVQEKLENAPEKLWSLSEMERTDGETECNSFPS